MKKILFLFALLLAVVSTSLAQSSIAENTTQEFSYIINTETSRMDLVDLRNQMNEYGVTFMYNPSFDQNRKLNGIKVRVFTDADNKIEYALNPMKAGDELIIERKLDTEGNLVLFVGERE